jgi:hypothetical protein
MKTLPLIFLLLLTSTVSQRPRKSSPLIETTYDRFDDTTSVSTTDITPHGNLMVSASFHYQGKLQPKINSVRLLFIGAPGFWATVDTSQPVSVLVDDVHPTNYTAKYSSTFQVAGLVNRVYALDFTAKDLALVGCGKKLEMRVGYQEVTFKPIHIEKFKALLTAIGGKCQ